MPPLHQTPSNRFRKLFPREVKRGFEIYKNKLCLLWELLTTRHHDKNSACSSSWAVLSLIAQTDDVTRELPSSWQHSYHSAPTNESSRFFISLTRSNRHNNRNNNNNNVDKCKIIKRLAKLINLKLIAVATAWKMSHHGQQGSDLWVT